MEKKVLLRIFQWVVALLACGWLVYRLVTYDAWSATLSQLGGMSWAQWLALLVCVALMPLNMTLEAWRWKTLVPMSWREAHRQVYYSKLAGVITPWKLGEYPARAMLQGEWKQTLSMGLVGSATMTLAIIGAGIVALAFSPKVLALLGGSYLYSLLVVSLVMGVVVLLMPKMLRQWAQVNGGLLWTSVLQSLVRLVCWCVQLALVLWALGGANHLSLGETALLTPVYYLLVTITPNVPIVEVGVRGAWAMWLFGTPNAALAGVLLWTINTLLPCLWGMRVTVSAPSAYRPDTRPS